jgi:hypothetical protein
MPKGTKINIEVDKAYSDIADTIKEDGYVKNTKLHRRWIMAQYMRMLNSKYGWHNYLSTHYSYMYQFDMMIEEVRVLSILERRDVNVFNERSHFFNIPTIYAVLDDYLNDVEEYLETLQIKKCRRRPYVYIKCFGNCYVDELDTRVITPIKSLIDVCKKCKEYDEMYNALCAFKKVMIKLPYQTTKSKAWVNAFQGEGAFYTLKNMVMYHNVTLPLGKNNTSYVGEAAMDKLTELLGIYEGYQYNALLKHTIEYNDFDFIKSIN